MKSFDRRKVIVFQCHHDRHYSAGVFEHKVETLFYTTQCLQNSSAGTLTVNLLLLLPKYNLRFPGVQVWSSVLVHFIYLLSLAIASAVKARKVTVICKVNDKTRFYVGEYMLQANCLL